MMFVRDKNIHTFQKCDQTKSYIGVDNLSLITALIIIVYSISYDRFINQSIEFYIRTASLFSGAINDY